MKNIGEGYFSYFNTIRYNPLGEFEAFGRKGNNNSLLSSLLGFEKNSTYYLKEIQKD